MALSDETIVNQIAQYERSITGVKNSYGFAQNPDVLSVAQLPACVHYAPSFGFNLKYHHLGFKTIVTLQSVLFVMPRAAKAGKLAYLENAAIPFGGLWRTKFSDATVINAIASATGAIRLFLESGEYGAGSGDGSSPLDFGDTGYVGWRFQFLFTDS